MFQGFETGAPTSELGSWLRAPAAPRGGAGGADQNRPLHISFPHCQARGRGSFYSISTTAFDMEVVPFIKKNTEAQREEFAPGAESALTRGHPKFPLRLEVLK